jgi:2,3-bisphosphoglycerate-independent phosphoglycerate mutase
VLFEHEQVLDSLGECIAANGLKQLRIAESEKSAHVTYFFSGGTDEQFVNETRRLIDSQPVATYDVCPRMSADAVTREVVEIVLADDYDLIVCNIANADMVGHTGDFKAAIEAVECIDECLCKILKACESSYSHCFITADHGNVECMYNTDSEQSHTAHTSNLVPLVYVGPDDIDISSRGSLADIAPTILDVMELPPIKRMTGRTLAIKRRDVQPA